MIAALRESRERGTPNLIKFKLCRYQAAFALDTFADVSV